MMEATLFARLRGALFAAGLAFAAMQACVAADAFTPAATLRHFASQAELLAWFEPFAAERRRQQELQRQRLELRRKDGASLAQPLNEAMPAPASAAPAVADRAAAPEPGITNNQTRGVDEGGIVKVHGRHLVILRRGRLYTVDAGWHQLAPVAAVDAFGPEVSGRGDWYDEMLVAGDNVAVIGYSYARGGTEIVLFHIDDAGRLAYRGTWQLKSADYYSSRNYASRLVGNKLVLYTPIPIVWWQRDPLAQLPALRHWRPGATPADFKAITPPTRIYRTDEALDPRGGATLHAVVSCDLAQPELRCEASGVLGAAGRVFYVSPTAVYVWATQSASAQPTRAAVFRLPLDGAAPSALKAEGSPVDQFSFLEQPDGMLNVLLTERGQGDGMGRGERAGGQLALLRVPVREFGDGSSAAPASAYRPLPSAGPGPLQDRYVGGFLLYGAGRRGREAGGELQVVDLRGGTSTLLLPHGIERIEAMGSDALAIGSDGRDLQFSSVQLGPQPAVAHRFTQPGAAQAEARSHGFFYLPEGPREGLVGLPVRGGGGAGGWPRQARDESAGMLYLQQRDLQLAGIGSLQARPGVGRHDDCQASCVDWYGNARPIFLRGRVFALLGYELVEGELLRGAGGQRRIVEARRISFAPGSADYQP